MIAKGTMTDRLAAIAPMVEFSRRTAKGLPRAMLLSDGRVLHTLDEPAKYIADQHGRNPQTIWKWYCQYKEYDFFGMAQVRSDCGRSLFFAKHRTVARYLKAMRLRGKTAVAIHRILQCKFPGKTPHINTLRPYLKSLQKTARRRSRQKKEAQQ
jgi:hypothetical protein